MRPFDSAEVRFAQDDSFFSGLKAGSEKNNCRTSAPLLRFGRSGWQGAVDG
jgi:hypothetical protein